MTSTSKAGGSSGIHAPSGDSLSLQKKKDAQIAFKGASGILKQAAKQYISNSSPKGGKTSKGSKSSTGAPGDTYITTPEKDVSWEKVLEEIKSSDFSLNKEKYTVVSQGCISHYQESLQSDQSNQRLEVIQSFNIVLKELQTTAAESKRRAALETVEVENSERSINSETLYDIHETLDRESLSIYEEINRFSNQLKPSTQQLEKLRSRLDSLANTLLSVIDNLKDLLGISQVEAYQLFDCMGHEPHYGTIVDSVYVSDHDVWINQMSHFLGDLEKTPDKSPVIFTEDNAVKLMVITKIGFDIDTTQLPVDNSSLTGPPVLVTDQIKELAQNLIGNVFEEVQGGLMTTDQNIQESVVSKEPNTHGRKEVIATLAKDMATGFILDSQSKVLARTEENIQAAAAETKIQTQWRMRQAKGELGAKKEEAAKARMAEEAATKIQAGFRGHVVRKKAKEAKEAKEAATTIQSAVRGRKARQKVAGIRKEKADSEAKAQAAAMKIQSRFRGHQARNELKKQNIAATNLQAIFRRSHARQQVAGIRKKKESATKIQTQWRVHKAKGELANKRAEAKAQAETETTGAATTIQSAVRGRIARQQVAKMKTQKEKAAATKIQAGFRVNQARKQVTEIRKEKAQKAISELSKEVVSDAISKAVSKVERKTVANAFVNTVLNKATGNLQDAMNKKSAATKIQAQFRGNQARKELKEQKEKSDAATTIQSHIRGNQTRKQVAKMKQEKAAAATKIQTQWRMKKAKGELGSKKAEAKAQAKDVSATKIQTQWRMRQAKGELSSKKEEVAKARIAEAAATTIQSHIRGHQTRKQVAGMRKEKLAATKIQAQFRGHLVRKEVQKSSATKGLLQCCKDINECLNQQQKLLNDIQEKTAEINNRDTAGFLIIQGLRKELNELNQNNNTLTQTITELREALPVHTNNAATQLLEQGYQGIGLVNSADLDPHWLKKNYLSPIDDRMQEELVSDIQAYVLEGGKAASRNESFNVLMSHVKENYPELDQRIQTDLLKNGTEEYVNYLAYRRANELQVSQKVSDFRDEMTLFSQSINSKKVPETDNEEANNLERSHLVNDSKAHLCRCMAFLLGKPEDDPLIQQVYESLIQGHYHEVLYRQLSRHQLLDSFNELLYNHVGVDINRHIKFSNFVPLSELQWLSDVVSDGDVALHILRNRHQLGGLPSMNESMHQGQALRSVVDFLTGQSESLELFAHAGSGKTALLKFAASLVNRSDLQVHLVSPFSLSPIEGLEIHQMDLKKKDVTIRVASLTDHHKVVVDEAHKLDPGAKVILVDPSGQTKEVPFGQLTATPYKEASNEQFDVAQKSLLERQIQVQSETISQLESNIANEDKALLDQQLGTTKENLNTLARSLNNLKNLKKHMPHKVCENLNNLSPLFKEVDTLSTNLSSVNKRTELKSIHIRLSNMLGKLNEIMDSDMNGIIFNAERQFRSLPFESIQGCKVMINGKEYTVIKDTQTYPRTLSLKNDQWGSVTISVNSDFTVEGYRKPPPTWRYPQMTARQLAENTQMNSNYKRLNYLHSNLSLTAFFKHFLDTEEPDSLFSITAKLAEVTKMILDYSDSDRYQQGLESKPELDKLQKKQEEYQAQLHKLQGRQVQERLESIQLKLSNLSSDKLDRINRIDHHQSDSMQLFSETMDMRRFQRDIEQSSRSQLIFPRVQFSSTGSIKQLCQNLSGSLGDNVHYLFHDPETGQDRVLIISGRESEPRIMSFDQYHKNDELKQSASKQVMLYDNTTMQGGDFKSISSVDSTVDQEDFSQVIVDDVFMEGFEDVQFSTSDYYQMTARARKTGARHSILYTRKSSDVFELDRTAKESRNLEGWIQKNLSCRLYNDLNHMYEVDRETFNDTISHTLETICENKNEIDLNNEDAVNALAEELVHTICENLPSNDICLDKPIRQWNIGYRLAQYINFRNSRHNGESKEI